MTMLNLIDFARCPKVNVIVFVQSSQVFIRASRNVQLSDDVVLSSIHRSDMPSAAVVTTIPTSGHFKACLCCEYG